MNMNLADEDNRMMQHTFRPKVHSDRTHGSNYKPTQKELDIEDAIKFEATIQAQLRDLFATV